MSKNNNQSEELNLSRVYNCISVLKKNFVYSSNTNFYQVTSQPNWIMALLSQRLLEWIVQYSGNIDSSEASNFMNKKINAHSHNIDKKLENLYEEFTRNDFQAIYDEENHIKIALSRGALVRKEGKGGKFDNGKAVSALKSLIATIDGATEDGAILADEIKQRLIKMLCVSITKQCLLQEAEKASDKLLEAIDAFKLLTAVIITSLNYKNTANNLIYENADDIDEVSLFIKRYLIESDEEISSMKSLEKSTDYSEQQGVKKKQKQEKDYEPFIQKRNEGEPLTEPQASDFAHLVTLTSGNDFTYRKVERAKNALHELTESFDLLRTAENISAFEKARTRIINDIRLCTIYTFIILALLADEDDVARLQTTDWYAASEDLQNKLKGMIKHYEALLENDVSKAECKDPDLAAIKIDFLLGLYEGWHLTAAFLEEALRLEDENLKRAESEVQKEYIQNKIKDLSLNLDYFRERAKEEDRIIDDSIAAYKQITANDTFSV